MQTDKLTPTQLPTALFFTLFNTHGTLNCCTTNDAVDVVACGYDDSIVRVHRASGGPFSLKHVKHSVEPGNSSGQRRKSSTEDSSSRSSSSSSTSSASLENRVVENTLDGKHVHRLDFVGHQGPVYSLDFCAQDHNYLISSSADRFVFPSIHPS